MINMLDDCSRVFTGSKIYERELLLSYLDFLPAAFIECGLPLEIYVDFHSLFFVTVRRNRMGCAADRVVARGERAG
jgi:hypothetical protein